MIDGIYLWIYIYIFIYFHEFCSLCSGLLWMTVFLVEVVIMDGDLEAFLPGLDFLLLGRPLDLGSSHSGDGSVPETPSGEASSLSLGIFKY